MTSGVANVWTNFSSSCFIDTPNGWLLNQKSCLLMFFERHKKSEFKNIKVYTYLFYWNELVEHDRLKNTIIPTLYFSFEIWNEMVEAVWTVVTNKFQ